MNDHPHTHDEPPEPVLPPETPVGFVKNAFRDGEQVTMTTRGSAGERIGEVDMRATVIIGGKGSRIWRRGADVQGIITARGYERKYHY